MVVTRDVFGNETCICPEPPPLNQPGYGLGGTVQGEAFNLTACSSIAISAYELQWNNVNPFYRLLLNFKDAMLAFDSFNRSVYGDFADPGSILHADSDMSALQCRNRVLALSDRIQRNQVLTCNWNELPPVQDGVDSAGNPLYKPFAFNNGVNLIGYWFPWDEVPGGLAMRLMPGVFCANGRSNFTVPAKGTLILDAQQDPKAIFVFRADTIVFMEGSSVRLINDASAVNVLWYSKVVFIGARNTTQRAPFADTSTSTLTAVEGTFVTTFLDGPDQRTSGFRQAQLEGQLLTYNTIAVSGQSSIRVPGTAYSRPFIFPPPAPIQSSSSSTGGDSDALSSSTASSSGDEMSSSTGSSAGQSSTGGASSSSTTSSSSTGSSSTASSSTGSSGSTGSSSTGSSGSTELTGSSSSSSSTGRSSSSSTGQISSSSSTGHSQSRSSSSTGAIKRSSSSSSTGGLVSPAPSADQSFIDSDAGIAVISVAGVVLVGGIAGVAYWMTTAIQAVQVVSAV